MKHWLTISTYSLLLFLPPASQGQVADKSLLKVAEERFENGQYFEALPVLEIVVRQYPKATAYKEKLGICYFHCNRLTSAKAHLTELAESKGTPGPAVSYYLGAIHHHENKFAEAARYYKTFLAKVSNTHPFQERAVEDVRRCGYAIRNPRIHTDVIIENLGSKVNSIGDEYGPVFHPEEADKLYFSSARPGSLGGRRNAQGIVDEKKGVFTADMYVSHLLQGEWTGTSPLNYLINSSQHDVLLDFSADGEAMYFFKGYHPENGEILIQNLESDLEERLAIWPFHGPLNPGQGDASLYFFNDTVLLFSSNRAGGYGGLDLYISFFSRGSWTQPENLGASVNTAFDESYPFLANDGRTLYFSSNRSDLSYGGYDFFKAIFTESPRGWSVPQNLGMPLNSPGDETHFRLCIDGHQAYFASSRKSGFGERDLFAAYLKDYKAEVVRAAKPPVLQQFSSLHAKSSSPIPERESASGHAAAPEWRKEYRFDPLHFDREEDLLLHNNLRTLQAIIGFLQEFPSVKIMLTSHSDYSEPPKYDLYFSIKRAEKVAGFLLENGIATSRIFLKGCGQKYPLATNEMDGSANPAGQRLNRRVEFSFFNTESLLVEVYCPQPDIPAAMAEESSEFFRAATRGLSYKVQVAAMAQLYQGDLMTQFSNGTVEKWPDTDAYIYSVGLYQTYASAVHLQEEFENTGLADTKVIAYIHGFPVGPEDAIVLARDYPDLQQFFASGTEDDR